MHFHKKLIKSSNFFLKRLFNLKCDIERFLFLQVYQGEEKEFHQLHEQIIRNNKCSPLPGQPNYGIVVSIRILHGELSQVREENPLLFKNICLTKKLGFSDVIMPGDVRNDLYLKLERGEFERGGKSTGKNIEVRIVFIALIVIHFSLVLQKKIRICKMKCNI